MDLPLELRTRQTSRKETIPHRQKAIEDEIPNPVDQLEHLGMSELLGQRAMKATLTPRPMIPPMTSGLTSCQWNLNQITRVIQLKLSAKSERLAVPTVPN